jgi:hypothetical protein
MKLGFLGSSTDDIDKAGRLGFDALELGSKHLVIRRSSHSTQRRSMRRADVRKTGFLDDEIDTRSRLVASQPSLDLTDVDICDLVYYSCPTGPSS